MRTRLFHWLGKEFLEISAAAAPDGDPAREAGGLFRRFAAELKHHGLSLDDTVRSRLWGRDRASRDAGSAERVRVLSGRARSASSSYIAPERFDSAARIALDLTAMRAPGSEKQIVEYDPPIAPIRFLVRDSIVVLSGVTAVLPTLEEQLDNILPRIAASLGDAGSSWSEVEQISFYLHRSQSVERLKTIFHSRVRENIPRLVYGLVDGYSAPGKLCEVEVTARRPPGGKDL